MTGVEILVGALIAAAVGSTLKQGIGAMQGQGVDPGNWLQDFFKTLPLAATGAGVAGAVGSAGAGAAAGLGEAGAEVIGSSVADMISDPTMLAQTYGPTAAAPSSAWALAPDAASLPIAMPSMTEQIFGQTIPGLKGARTATGAFGQFATTPGDFPDSTYLRGDLAFGGAMSPMAGPGGPQYTNVPPASRANRNRFGVTPNYNYGHSSALG